MHPPITDRCGGGIIFGLSVREFVLVRVPKGLLGRYILQTNRRNFTKHWLMV